MRPLDAGVRRIALFRALVLGDVLCAVPAWRALRAACPAARLTLVGLPWARELAQRLSCLDDFVAFPGHPALPEGRCDARAWPAFLARLRAHSCDVALQMHGSGTVTNPLVRRFGAQRTVGFCTGGDGGEDPADFMPWPQQGHEIDRLLSLTDALGVPRRGRALEFPLGEADRRALRQRGLVPPRSYVVVHPGAQLPSRCWPAACFARVADALAGAGHAVVLTGTSGEAPLVRQVQAAMRAPATDLAGRTGLFELGALVERARLVVCNDTGISHVAAALQVPSVVISSGGDVARWRPLDAQRHRVLWRDAPCRPCAHPVCPYGHECARGVPVEAVLDAARALLRKEPHAT